MEYKVNTSFNIGDKLYSLTDRGTILEYYISKIDFTGVVNCDHDLDANHTIHDYDLNICYSISNSSNKIITRLSASKITERYFINKKDIVKHIMDQL